MSVRQQDIAAYLGVSVSTVSLALRDSSEVSEDTRQLVRDTAERLGYAPRARSSFDDRVPFSRIKYLAADTPNNSFYNAVLAGAASECRRHGIELEFMQIEADWHFEAGLFRTSEALLAVGTLDEALVLALRDLDKPLVLVDNNLPHLNIDRVLTENMGTVYNAVLQLAQWGHQQIAFLEGPSSASSFVERHLGYLRGMSRLSLAPFTLACDYASIAVSEQAVRAWLDTYGKPPFTALICCNDEAAIGAIHAFNSAGLRVPEDVAVVGFDDIDMARAVRPALTTYHVHRELFGATAVRCLLERVKHPTAPPQAIVLGTQLVERASAGSRDGHRISA